MTVKTARLQGSWGHVALLAGFIAFVVWYFIDSMLASDQIQNLLLIGPTSVVALTIAAALLVRAGRRLWLPSAERGKAAGRTDRRGLRHRYGAPASMASMVAFVAVLPWLGFDFATFCFVAANMWIYGERNPVLIAVYASVLGVAVAAAMRHLLFVPIPTLLPL